VTEEEWFYNLTVEERVLAVSTIFPEKNKALRDLLVNKINDVQQNNINFDLEGQQYSSRICSNDDYISHNYYRSSISQYASHNTLHMQKGFISRHITFIDTFYPEDTLTVDEEIVQNPDVFFDILEDNKK
jgi:hypothetical protein